MTQLIPNRLLFDFELPITYRAKAPGLRGDLADYSEAYALPPLCELEGQDAFAEIFVCWNEAGIYIGCHVPHRWNPPQCDPSNFRRGDVLRICTDMRDTRDQKRAGRFCQAFYAMPLGGGRDGRQPVAGSHKLQQARQDAPVVAAGALPVASKVSRNEYTLELHLPAQHLAGFDPAEHPRIGFYYQVEDTQHGRQALTVGDELNWYVDPSTWLTAVMAR